MGGDEDNGSMSAWFLLSAMGLYQLAPGNTMYSIGSPLHQHVRVSMDNGNVLDIVAPGNNALTPYVRSVAFNGRSLANLSISYAELRSGGLLQMNVSASGCADVEGGWPC